MGGQFGLGNGNVTGPNYQFDDGYVKVDDTGNAGGFTSFWGYDNASQHPAAAPGTLLFHSSSAYSTPTSQVQRDDTPYVGFDMAYGGTFGQWHGARLGWEFGMGFVPISITDGRNLPAVFTTGTYAVSVPSDPNTRSAIVLPQPGYRGGSSGVGPVIGATPSGPAIDVANGTI